MVNWTRGAAALLATAALSSATAVADAAPLQLRRCAPRSRQDRTRCGRVAVPLDRSGAVPGTVGLRVRVREPRRRAKGTVFALAGGPGQAATPLIGDIAAMLRWPLRSRRLVTFDQRGTGRSGRLRCPSLAKVGKPSQLDAAVAACADRLGPARTAYTSAASVEDLEAVRAALGVERIAIYGVSYGTKVALDYAARYPQHVSRLVLDSVVPPAGSDPFMRATVASVPRVLRSLCGARDCPFTRDPGRDVAALVKRIARDGALRGTVFDGRGRPHRVAIERELLLSLLLEGDFDVFARAATPAAVRAALAGDTAPLARLAAAGQTGLDDAQDSDALNLATVCEDGGVPWPAGTPVAARPAAIHAALAAVPEAALLPFDRETLRRSGGLGYCRAWPESPIAQPTAPLPDVPTLLLSGDDDLRTPRSDAEALAAQLPSARLVTVPATGHSVLGSDFSGCAEVQLRMFFADRRVRDCRRRGARFPAPAALPAARFAALPRPRGLPPRIGRTLTAVELTLTDFGEQLLRRMSALLSGEPRIAFGGLRGGYAAIDGRGVRLHRYSAVPGVALTIVRLTRTGDVTLRVSGRAAARGTVVFGDRATIATLGGRRIRLGEESSQGRAAAAGGAGAAASGRSLHDAVGRVRALLADPDAPPHPRLPRAPAGPPGW